MARFKTSFDGKKILTCTRQLPGAKFFSIYALSASGSMYLSLIICGERGGAYVTVLLQELLDATDESVFLLGRDILRIASTVF